MEEKNSESLRLLSKIGTQCGKKGSASGGWARQQLFAAAKLSTERVMHV
jgi:hypothetical protein